jgi:hypothetical protein
MILYTVLYTKTISATNYRSNSPDPLWGETTTSGNPFPRCGTRLPGPLILLYIFLEAVMKVTLWLYL